MKGRSLLLLLGLVCAGCVHPESKLLQGNADAAQVGYEGADLTAATAVAKNHCARFERVAKFLNAAEDVAYFACVHR